MPGFSATAVEVSYFRTAQQLAERYMDEARRQRKALDTLSQGIQQLEAQARAELATAMSAIGQAHGFAGIPEDAEVVIADDQLEVSWATPEAEAAKPEAAKPEAAKKKAKAKAAKKKPKAR